MRATMRAVTIKLKGARYYDAEAAHACGDLALSKSVLLKPEPNNRYDKNAVAVLSLSGKMMGHISRDIAGKYKELVLLDQVVESSVYSADKINDYQKFDIRISITYFAPDIEFGVRFPETAGTYLITLGIDRVYIGATGNLKRRCKDHLRDLFNKTHANNTLQADFNHKNLDSFKFIVLREAESLQEAEEFESKEILRRMRSGEKLYNKTLDGKGLYSRSLHSQRTVSDIYIASEKLVISSSDLNSDFRASASDLVRSEDLDSPPNVPNARNIAQPLESKSQISPTNRVVGYSEILAGIGNAEVASEFEGQKLVMEDGAIYEGNIVDGKMHGYGKYTWKNGDYYIGNFRGGVRVWGDGRFYKSVKKTNKSDN